MKKVCFIARMFFGMAAVTAVMVAAGCRAVSAPATPTFLPAASATGLPAPTHAASPTAAPSPALTFTRTPSPSPTPQPGCLPPTDDYTRVDLPHATLNTRTYEMLLYAACLYDGPINLLEAITQGSYTDTEEASFGTHSGGGAVDLSVIDTGTWTVLTDEIEPLVRALRLAGFAAWLRPPDALYPGSPIHIHAVAVGDEELSYAAWLQVHGEYG
ncbi:MAG: hypothetical protein AAGU05_02405, partial [Anaerolineaceae bacterium]